MTAKDHFEARSVFPFSHIALAAFCLAGFASFIWTTRVHFADTGERPVGMKAVFALTPLGVLATLLTIFFSSALAAPFLGALVYVSSLSLFWWTISATRSRHLSIVFSTDAPKLLVAEGPYAWIRHPFYTSYLLFWFAGFIGTGAVWLLLPLIVMSCLYWQAAKAEERKFSHSPLAHEYASYITRTKMFVPWLI